MPSVRQMWSHWYTVKGIAQTPDGFLWIAANDAIERFDGRRFQRYQLKVDTGGPDLFVSLAAGPDGAVYAGLVDGRLARIAPGADEIEIVNGGAPVVKKAATVLAAPSRDHVWLGNDDGLWRWDVRPGTSAVRVPGGPTRTVHAMALDEKGRLWVGASHALLRQGDTGFEPIRTDLHVVSLAAHPGGLWVLATGDKAGLYHLVGEQSRESEFVAKSELGTNARALASERDGTAWAFVNASELVRHKAGRLSHRIVPFNARELFVDREGGLWANAWTDLVRVGAARTQVFRGFQEDVGGRGASGVLEGRDGTIWATIGDRLLRIRGREVRHFDRNELQGIEGLRSMAQADDAEGSIWITTSRGAVLRVGQTISVLRGKEAGVPAIAMGIAIDRDGVVWITAKEGLRALRSGRFVGEAAFENTAIRTIIASRAGGLWLGIPEQGLVRYHDGRMETHGPAEGLDRTHVNTILERPDGTLWVGVRGGGLYRFSHGRFQPLGAKAGFPARSVHGIVEDGRGDLWVSTDAGLYRLLAEDIEPYFAGRKATVRTFRYGVADGFDTDRFADGYGPTATRGRDGRLWFPTNSSVAVMRAPETEIPPPPPTIVFEEVRVGASIVRVGAREQMRMTVDPGDLAVRFTAPTFTSPHRLKFQHRLDGHQDAWVDTAEDRVARYAAVTPGRYTMRVRAWIDEPGAEQTETALVIDLARPLRHWLYPSAGLLGAVALAFAAQRYRVRRARRRFDAVLAERNRIARDLHDTLAQGFAGIGYQLQHLEQARADAAETERALKTLRTLVRVSRVEARQAIWNLRAETPDGRPLIERLREIGQQAGLSSSAIVELAVDGEARPLPAAIEEEIARVAQEAITNALVHGRARRIDVCVAFDGRGVTLEVRDEGAGFEPGTSAEPGTQHFGLQGMKERAERVGGTLEVGSEPGKGTTVKLVVPGARRETLLCRFVRFFR